MNTRVHSGTDSKKELQSRADLHKDDGHFEYEEEEEEEKQHHSGGLKSSNRRKYCSMNMNDKHSLFFFERINTINMYFL